MFMAGCGLLTFILLKRAHRYFGPRRHKKSSDPIEHVHRPTDKWDGVQRDSLAQIERQRVEMHEMARDLNGQLTSRIVLLERLIGESQQQIERLEELLDEAKEERVVKSE